MPNPVQIAVVGASGSGKTWLAQRLCSELHPDATHLKLDDFYRDLSPLEPEDRARVNFDDPGAIDWDRVRSVMAALSSGKPAEVPIYDFATHTRFPEVRLLQPAQFVIWDGLWLLRDDWLRLQFSISVFVDCDAGERLARRLARDVLERGRTPESVRRQYVEQVEPMCRQYVEPQRQLSTCCLASPLAETDFTTLLATIRALNTAPRPQH